MITKIILYCKTVLMKLLSSLRRFPEAILLATTIVFILIFINHNNLKAMTEEFLTRVCLILALGIPVSLSIRVIFERIPNLKQSTKILIYFGVIAGLILYFNYLLKDFDMVSVSRYIAFSISFYASFAFIPYFYKKKGFELYIIKLITSFAITYLYSLILYLGFAAMFFTVDLLFSINMSEKLYFDMMLIIAGVFAPAFFLADIPEYGKELYIESYPKVIKVLLLYIVLPMIVAYSTILYVYFVKILVTWQWPKGIVANLVLWYSIISTLALFFIYPLRNLNKWPKAFISFFPKFIIPLLGMMFVSMIMRINAYGITESRYFVMLVGLWVTGCMIYYIVAKDAKNIVLPVSIALISILSVTGPWSCYSVSKFSQNLRFERILEKNNMIQNRSIIRSTQDISITDKKEISSIIRYFNTYHDLRDLKYLPHEFSINEMNNVFGFQLYKEDIKDNIGFIHSALEDDAILNIEGYDYFIYVSGNRVVNLNAPKNDLQVKYSPNEKELKIFKKGELIYSRNVEDLGIIVHNKYREEKEIKMSDMVITEENDKVKVYFAFNRIIGAGEIDSGQVKIENVDFYLFTKLITD